MALTEAWGKEMARKFERVCEGEGREEKQRPSEGPGWLGEKEEISGLSREQR